MIVILRDQHDQRDAVFIPVAGHFQQLPILLQQSFSCQPSSASFSELAQSVSDRARKVTL